MPAVSRRQQQFMAICAHSRGKARGKCPPQNVAEEFSHGKALPETTAAHHAQKKRGAVRYH